MLLTGMLDRLAHSDLTWGAELNLIFRGRPTRSGRPHFMRLHRRPVLVYRRPGFQLYGWDDLIEVPAPAELPSGLDQNEKAMALLLERLVRPGQTVCGPIALDRTGTALAARKMACTFIGATDRQTSVDRIRGRLSAAEGNGKF